MRSLVGTVRECAIDEIDQLRHRGLSQTPRPLGEASDPARAVDQDAARAKRAQERETGGIDEAQRGTGVDIPYQRSHGNELTQGSLNQARSRVPADSQPRSRAASPDRDLACKQLGVDDCDPPWSDRDVIDVRAGLRHPPVVQQDHARAAEQLLEPDGCTLLSLGTAQPRLLVRRRRAEGDEQAPGSRMALSYRLLAR